MQLGAIVQAESSGGSVVRAIVDGGILADDYRSAQGMAFRPRGAKASAQENGGDGQRHNETAEAWLEGGTPLQTGQQKQPQPKRAGRQEAPFVQSQFPEPAVPSARDKS